MIIITKQFSEDLLLRRPSLKEYEEQQHKAYHSLDKPTHELSKTGLSDPNKREEMVRKDVVNDTLDILKKNNWDVMKIGKEDKIDHVDESHLNSMKPATIEDTVKKSTKGGRVRVSEVPTPVEEAVKNDGAGMSDAAKLGLATAGVAAVGAGSYAAYKAIKRRKAEKAAVNAEVDRFLNEKYKTE